MHRTTDHASSAESLLKNQATVKEPRPLKSKEHPRSTKGTKRKSQGPWSRAGQSQLVLTQQPDCMDCSSTFDVSLRFLHGVFCFAVMDIASVSIWLLVNTFAQSSMKVKSSVCSNFVKRTSPQHRESTHITKVAKLGCFGAQDTMRASNMKSTIHMYAYSDVDATNIITFTSSH